MARGVSFGRYVIVKRLAVGAMSEVFLAEQAEAVGDERWVALKRLRPEALRDEAQAEAFLRESELLVQLSHPYLVRVRASGREDGLPWIALEYVHGITLEGLLEARRARGEAPLPWPAVARIAGHVCECLLHLGGLETMDGTPLGLVHRDIHPGNIMLSQSGCTRLLDFGIAHALGLSGHEAARQVHARLGYAAPEQLRALPTDERTDVYGLALTVYELLTETQPFARETAAEVAQAVASERPPRLSRFRRDVPGPLSSMIDAALAKSPSARPRLSELRATLESALLQHGEVVGLPELASLVAPELPGAGRLRWAHSAGAPASATSDSTQTLATRSRVNRPT